MRRVFVAALVLSFAPIVELGAQTPDTAVVDGVPIRYVVMGRDPASDQATVLVEAGAGSSIESWSPLLSRLAERTRVVSYDRTGIGGSGWDGRSPDPATVSSMLRSLLDEVGVAPPYVVVGHSWGGALVQDFAATHPELVAGLVYIDPNDFTWTPEDEIAVLESVGMDSVYYEERRARRNARVAALPPRVRAEREVINTYTDRWGWLRSEVELPDVPISVVVASQRPIPTNSTVPFEVEPYLNTKYALRLERLAGWVRGGGRFVVADSDEHYVHREAPDLVAEVILALVEGRE